MTAFSSNRRAVVVKDRCARRASPRADRRLAVDIILWGCVLGLVIAEVCDLAVLKLQGVSNVTVSAPGAAY